MRACVRACLRACVPACVRVCVCVCACGVRACVNACVRDVCMCVFCLFQVYLKVRLRWKFFPLSTMSTCLIVGLFLQVFNMCRQTDMTDGKTDRRGTK